MLPGHQQAAAWSEEGQVRHMGRHLGCVNNCNPRLCNTLGRSLTCHFLLHRQDSWRRRGPVAREYNELLYRRLPWTENPSSKLCRSTAITSLLNVAYAADLLGGDWPTHLLSRCMQVVVIVMSLGFILFVTVLHIIGKVRAQRFSVTLHARCYMPSQRGQGAGRRGCYASLGCPSCNQLSAWGTCPCLVGL
jgi:hypothetical protein